jgi:hypothetical protein
VFWGCLFFHRRSFVLSLLRSSVASFFIGALSFCAPCVLGLPLFSSEVFRFEPLRFGIASFLSEVFCFEPLAFWGCLFFYQRSFILNQRTKVAIMRLRSWLWLMWHNSLFVEYVASVASDFDDGDQCFGEMKLIWAPPR